MAQETPAEVPSEEPVSVATETPQETPSQEYVSKSDYEAGIQVLAEEVKSLRQSGDDRAKNAASVSDKVTDKLAQFDATFQALRPLMREDVSPEEVEQLKERQFVRDLMQQPTSDAPELEPDVPPQAEVPAPASVPPGRESEIAQILEQHEGLSGKEPEFVEFAKKHEGEPWWKVGAEFDALAKSIATRNAGNPAGVIAPQGQAANPDLIQEFRTELSGILYPKDTEGKLLLGQRRTNMQTLRSLQEKYVEKGAKIEDLDVSPTGGVPPGDTISDWAPPA